MLASPFGNLKRSKLKTNAAEILTIAHKENAGGLVVGLPLLSDGRAPLVPAAQARPRLGSGAAEEATQLPVSLVRRAPVERRRQPISDLRSRRQPP